MKSFFRDLFQYNHHYNSQLLSAMTGYADRTPEKSLRLMSHIVNVHHIWSARIQGVMPLWENWKTHEIQEAVEMDEGNLSASLHILDRDELDRLVHYTTGQGKTFGHSVRDLLFQVINHSTYHRGQIATDFRQNGLEPLLTDYIFYKMI